jgi:Icc-related predicted phosphoesterase
MKLGALGDVHGDFVSVRAIMARHPQVEWWVTVGDLGSAAGAYETPPRPLYWIKGNNDNLEVVADLVDGRRELPNLRYIPNGLAVHVGPLVVAGLGGTFAPTWFDRAPEALPRPRIAPAPEGGFPPLARDDKRRHFVRAEVEACTRLAGVDLFLSHESARPFFMEVRGRRQDVGKTPINEVLAAMRPRMHLSGHHHVYSDDVRQGVRSIGLDPVGVSYLLIDVATWKYERLET